MAHCCCGARAHTLPRGPRAQAIPVSNSCGFLPGHRRRLPFFTLEAKVEPSQVGPPVRGSSRQMHVQSPRPAPELQRAHGRSPHDQRATAPACTRPIVRIPARQLASTGRASACCVCRAACGVALRRHAGNCEFSSLRRDIAQAMNYTPTRGLIAVV